MGNHFKGERTSHFATGNGRSTVTHELLESCHGPWAEGKQNHMTMCVVIMDTCMTCNGDVKDMDLQPLETCQI